MPKLHQSVSVNWPLLLLVFVLFNNTINCQSNNIDAHSWIRDWQFPSSVDTCAQLSNGNIIVGGSYMGSISFQSPSSSKYLTSKGMCDFYLASYSPNGELVWLTSFGKSSYTGETSILKSAIDNNDNVYVTGSIAGGADNAFINKFSSNGIELWQYLWQAEGIENQVITQACCTSNQGNPIVLGKFKGRVDLDPTSDTRLFRSEGDFDIFVNEIRENGSGNAIIMKNIEAADGYDISVDAYGDIYILGCFSSNLHIETSNGMHSVSSAPNSKGQFLLCLDAYFNFKWIKKWQYTEQESEAGALHLLIDANNEILVSGLTKTTRFLDDIASSSNISPDNLNDAFPFIITFSRNGEVLGVDTFQNFHCTQWTLVHKDYPDGFYLTSAYLMNSQDTGSISQNSGSIDRPQTAIFRYGPHNVIENINILASEPGENSFFLPIDIISGINDSIYIAGLFNGSIRPIIQDGGSIEYSNKIKDANQPCGFLFKYK
jgi:hypothetical protein